MDTDDLLRCLVHIAGRNAVPVETTRSDFHLTGMLSNALMKRRTSRNSFSKVVAVDRGLKTRRKWLKLVRGCANARVHYRSFSHFADIHLKK